MSLLNAMKKLVNAAGNTAMLPVEAVRETVVLDDDAPGDKVVRRGETIVDDIEDAWDELFFDDWF